MELLLLALLLLVSSCQAVDLTGVLDDVGDGGGTLPNGGKLWALLVAGSNGWSNYRHQADVAHAYQVLSAHGIPDQQIVVMMYDDIAYSTYGIYEESHYLGKLYNRPGGPDVFHGLVKDYTHRMLTPDIFISVLQGKLDDWTIGSKVIRSGPKDHIFVYFSGHGTAGLLGFPYDYYNPEHPRPFLSSYQLYRTIYEMHKAKKYAKMVFYLESCQSASMFDNFDDLADLNFYATTACGGEEFSYVCYYDDHLGTYLGDVFSVKWLEDSDKENIEEETIESQYEIVRQETFSSNVTQLGDLSMANMTVGLFQGLRQGRKKKQNQPERDVDRNPFSKSDYYCNGTFAVAAPEVRRTLLEKAVERSETKEELANAKKALYDYMAEKEMLESVMADIVYETTGGDKDASSSVLSGPRSLKDHKCFHDLLHTFARTCPHLFQYERVTWTTYALANLCSEGHSMIRATVAMSNACQKIPDIVLLE